MHDLSPVNPLMPGDNKKSFVLVNGLVNAEDETSNLGMKIMLEPQTLKSCIFVTSVADESESLISDMSYQYIFMINSINPFSTNVALLYPLKT